MSDIINLLPDSVANQIAAGEVIQRPASVIKELVENSIDAGADEIIIIIKDSGKTLIQVSDNGKGMSETDARMAFERHATSKIKTATDLFSIRSMGFRGEALASVAAVADVELKTKQEETDLGTYINIKGSEVIKQEAISCKTGSNFIIKNLFYNIPARRKFLKNDVTEFNHIITEFEKTAISNPEISFSLYHNDKTIFNLKKDNLAQRISDIFGKTISKNLFPISSNTEMLKIYGYIGKPEIARKRNKEQYFFVNKRFMKHPYFFKAVMSAYEGIIRADYIPSYFIFFDIEPDLIDINIHPQKVEINFEDTQGVFQILRATVKQALGKFNIVPSIDFNRDGEIEYSYNKNNPLEYVPEVDVNKEYNPFEVENKFSSKMNFPNKINKNSINSGDWESLFSDFSNQNDFETTVENTQTSIEETETESFSRVFQIKNKYIVTPVKSGLMIINQKRAHERILYETFINSIKYKKINTQKNLYPEEIEIDSADFNLLEKVIPEMNSMGFEIEITKKNNIRIDGLPANISHINTKYIIEEIILNLRDGLNEISLNSTEFLAETAAKASSMNYSVKLAQEEMTELIDKLFSCMMPNYTVDGRTIISIISFDEIDKLFK
jgi:DNA mismatch repair protein MutL